jgi:Flp pilus assembly protein TadB
MKKAKIYFSLAAMLFAFSAQAESTSSLSAKEPKTISAEQLKRMDEIESRVLEIREMDFSTLDKAEKKAIKTELKELNKEAKRGGGLYLSLGAIIVIVLLLILLL